jgi:hypothetical protein
MKEPWYLGEGGGSLGPRAALKVLEKEKHFLPLWEFEPRTVHVLISGFRRDADGICGHLGYYAVKSGNYVPTFRDNLSVLSSRVLEFLRLENGADRLSRNVSTELQL